ncbi:MAG: transcriptional regulator [Bacteroidetes bacterium HGW-Bacteroidetes-11]|jgi:putative transcriptional regulator|nr:MAG: transcriptional regulator [Bacteroidetes bacterium HGW-Bacteroidetes-11]
MSNIKITNNIRKFRFFADEMTQQQLADLTGVTRQTIVAIENGKYFPTLELAFKISKVFKTSLEEVFTFEDGSPIQQEKPEKN